MRKADKSPDALDLNRLDEQRKTDGGDSLLPDRVSAKVPAACRLSQITQIHPAGWICVDLLVPGGALEQAAVELQGWVCARTALFTTLICLLCR